MGTNYYLQRPAPVCFDCQRPLDEQQPDRIHIGKASIGSVWLWRGYEPGDACDGSPALNDTLSWFEFLAANVDRGGEIVDERDDRHTLASLITRVVLKRGSRKPEPDPLPLHWVASEYERMVGEESILFSEFS